MKKAAEKTIETNQRSHATTQRADLLAARRACELDTRSFGYEY